MPLHESDTVSYARSDSCCDWCDKLSSLCVARRIATSGDRHNRANNGERDTMATLTLQHATRAAEQWGDRVGSFPDSTRGQSMGRNGEKPWAQLNIALPIPVCQSVPIVAHKVSMNCSVNRWTFQLEALWNELNKTVDFGAVSRLLFTKR